MLVIVDGADGVGKTTLCRNIASHYSKKDFSSSYMRSSGKSSGSIGSFIYALRKNRGVCLSWEAEPTELVTVQRSAIPELVFEILNICAHADTVLSDVARSLKRDDLTIVDRGWGSTYSYIALHSNREIASQFMLAELEIWKRVEPPIVFLLEREHCLRPDELEPDEFVSVRSNFREAYNMPSHAEFTKTISTENLSESEVLKEVTEIIDTNIAAS